MCRSECLAGHSKLVLTNVALNGELVFQQLNALLNGERDCRAGLSTVECLAEW